MSLLISCNDGGLLFFCLQITQIFFCAFSAPLCKRKSSNKVLNFIEKVRQAQPAMIVAMQHATKIMHVKKVH